MKSTQLKTHHWAYLGLTARDNWCWNNFTNVLFFIDNCFQIDCCDNHWRNFCSVLCGSWHLDVFWKINCYLKFAPAHLFKVSHRHQTPKWTSSTYNMHTHRIRNLTRWWEGQLENFEIDSQDGPFIFLLTKKSSRALSIGYLSVVQPKQEYPHWWS